MASERVKVPHQPTHAVNFIDNWDGQRDQVFVFAFKHEDKLFSFETGEPLHQYEGDEVVFLWELSESKSKDMPTLKNDELVDLTDDIETGEWNQFKTITLPLPVAKSLIEFSLKASNLTN